jgi:hypothetical protein
MDELGHFARELAGLNCPICLRIVLLCSLPSLPLGKIFKKGYISAISPNSKENTILHAKLKPKNTRVTCRDTLDTNEARGFKKR